MTVKMIINAVLPEEHRIAFIKDGVLDGFHIESSNLEDRTGNIYKGRVEKIEPGLQACFVNFGAERNGFLSASEIHPEYYMDEAKKASEGFHLPIDRLIKEGQELMVQVIREMPGQKGAQLTTYISLAGRYLVLTPGRTINGISRKIEDEQERARLKAIMNTLKLPPQVGYIIRTVAQGQNKRAISKDLNRLVRMWNDIKSRVRKAPLFSLIHKEQDICLRTLRDYYTSDVSEIIVDDRDTYYRIKRYMKIIAPRDQRKVKLYRESTPIFDRFGIEEQIEVIYKNRVPLKTGGYIVIDSTEALISIDVNSGRSMVRKDLETLAFRTNMEAAKEVARQLRLRDIGGLVVIDFIDMKDKRHIRQLEKMFRQELKRDRARITVSGISRFGLMELSRQRLRPSIESRSFYTCSYCNGRGSVISIESASTAIIRRIMMILSRGGVRELYGWFHPHVVDYLQNQKRKELAGLEARYQVSISLNRNEELAPGRGRIEIITDKGKRELPVDITH
jgi:ribonuclease E